MKYCQLMLTLALVTTSACTNTTYGSGIGRPAVTPVDRLPLYAVAITAVYAAAADPAKRYAEIVYTGAVDGNDCATSDNCTPPQGCVGGKCAGFDLRGYRLCSTSTDNCVAPTVANPGSGVLTPIEAIPANTPTRLSLVAMKPDGSGHVEAPSLLGTADDIGLVDAEGFVHAFMAWGADPATLGSPIAAAAVMSGATKPGEFIPIPFPMPTNLAVAHSGVDVGCFTAALVTPTQPPPCPTAAPVLRLTEICPYPCPYVAVIPPTSCATTESCDTGQTCINSQCTPLPIQGSAVEIENPSTDALALHGVRLCVRPGCLVFSRDLKIGAESQVAVWLGTPAPAAPFESRAGELFYPETSPLGRAGEIALFAPGSAGAASGAALQSFVRYGDTPSVLAPIAASVGLWPDPLAAARTVRINGESLSHDLTTDATATAWNPAQPTLLLPNLDIRAATDLWDTCSFPRPWREPPTSVLVISRVLRSASPAVEIVNRSEDGSAAPLAGMTLELGGTSFDLSACSDLASGATLTVTVVTDGTPPPCADGALSIVGSLGASGDLALVDATGAPVMRQYLRWTDPAADPPPPVPAGAAIAVQDGVWPLERCTLGVLATDGALTLSAGLAGHAPPDYQ